MVANGTTKLLAYGRYVGQRYQNFTNILWVYGGDYNPPDKTLTEAVANGIRAFDTHSLGTAHAATGTAALDEWPGEPWLQVNNAYTYDPVYAAALQQYQRPDWLPFFLIESVYEDEQGSTTVRVRTQAYHALLSGAMGQMFGNNAIWRFGGPGIYPTPYTWQQSLGRPGSVSMTQLHNLFAARAWWTLVPDAGNTLLTAGLGSGQGRAVAARASDGSFALAYLPDVRSVTLSLGQLAGPHVTARWFDPANGAYSAIAGSPFTASGSRAFTPTASNSAGDPDWVLVLESVP
jgi:hypothetical protein